MLKNTSHTILMRIDQAMYGMFELTEEEREVIEDYLEVF